MFELDLQLKKMKKHLYLLTILMCLVFTKLTAQDLNLIKPANHERILKIDYNKKAGELNKMFKECIGAGRANEGLRADWQQQLALVKKECDFKYIRMHGLLTDDMGVYQEEHKKPTA